MSDPTPQQIAAMHSIQLRIQNLYEATKAVNALIDQHNLEADYGIKRLPYYSLGSTVADIAEAYRITEMVKGLERIAA